MAKYCVSGREHLGPASTAGAQTAIALTIARLAPTARHLARAAASLSARDLMVGGGIC